MKTRHVANIMLLLAVLLTGATAEDTKVTEPQSEKVKTEDAIFAGGCFWCVEAVFERVDGVTDAISGYIGGHKKNPGYKEVCAGVTGHAEAVKIVFDPAVVDFDHLLDVFFTTHDPTTLNRQGADAGTQYRSAIFPQSDEQQNKAVKSITKWNQSGEFKNPIVTSIEKADTFYTADVSHQDYFALNPNAGYCRIVIAPKIRKFEKQHKKIDK